MGDLFLMNTIECACCHKPTPVIEEGLDHICGECLNSNMLLTEADIKQLDINIEHRYGSDTEGQLNENP